MSYIWRSSRQYGSSEAHELHQMFPPIDLHADTLMWMRRFRYDIGVRHRRLLPKSAWVGHVDLPQLDDINAGAQFFSVATAPFRFSGLYRLANQQIDQLDAARKKYSDRLMLAHDVGDVMRARAQHKVAAFLSLEGAHFLEGSVNNLHRLARRGLKSFGLVHFTPNAAASPNYGLWANNDSDLTDFGRRLVHDCGRLGVIVDLAHANLRCFLHTCAITNKPAIVSHTGVCGAYRHRRNINDEQIRAIADTGGVIGIMYEPRYLGGKDVFAVMRHLQHVINVVGDEYVALGSDFDGMITPVRGLERMARLPNLTDAMIQAGWSKQRIGRILCQNVMRVLRDSRPDK